MNTGNSLIQWCKENNAEHILSEWDYGKNSLVLEELTAGSNKMAWWHCANGHSWQAAVFSRTRGSGCPFCAGQRVWSGYNDLETVYPALARQWHPSKNALPASQVLAGSAKKAWWICDNGHEFQSAINGRIKGNGCPICSGKIVLPGYNDIATIAPEIAMQWHPTLNGDTTPSMMTKGSHKKVWWLCSNNHAYLAPVTARFRGSGSPYCSNKKLIPGETDLATRRPDLAAEWNYEKNDPLTPEDVAEKSNKRVWWICAKGHEWQDTIENRHVRLGCPYCRQKRALPGVSDLCTTYPEIAAEWHPTKNGIKPTEVVAGSNRKVWWRCASGHEWEATINSRTKLGCNCPICNSERQTSFAEKAIAFYVKKKYPDAIENHTAQWLGKQELDVYIPSCSAGIEYDGAAWHTNIDNDKKKDAACFSHGTTLFRIREMGCPILESTSICIPVQPDKSNFGYLTPIIRALLSQIDEFSGNFQFIDIDVVRDYTEILNLLHYQKKSKSLASCNPGLAEEWDTEKNGDLTPDRMSHASNRKVWWICKLGHSWQASIANRAKGKGCPFCTGRKALRGFNDLRTAAPLLAEEWNPERNGNLSVEDVTLHSNKKVWWKCASGHEWEAVISARARGTGCPYCSGLRVLSGFNDLTTTHPDIAAQWHPTENGDLLPSHFSKGSMKKVWWKCETGHKWEAAIYSRVAGNGCPICARRK